MHCPTCSSNNLKIEVNFSGRVACRFADDNDFELIDGVSLDSYWNDVSPCECLCCHWNGAVRDARSTRAGEPGADEFATASAATIEQFSVDEIREMKRLLAADECSPTLRKHVEKLLDEVQRLSSLLESMSRITQQSADSDNDTIIG